MIERTNLNGFTKRGEKNEVNGKKQSHGEK